MSPEAVSDRARRLIDFATQHGGELKPTAADQLLRYLDGMLDINQRINLTGVRDPDQAFVLHALDGLAFVRTGLAPHHVLDLGTGNGFPGVCVAALHPRTDVVLMDKTGKKIRAIGTTLISAGLDAVDAIQLDAAQAPALNPDLRHAFDVVTARAVGRPEVVAPLAEPLCRPGGHLVLWLEHGAETPDRLGRFRLTRTLDYDLPEPAARKRTLALWQA
ncbi:MAG: class I SAM-dependent methyltransferase [bacterium]|nr:class I SAM-dependent methyltransferase [bacterium]